MNRSQTLQHFNVRSDSPKKGIVFDVRQVVFFGGGFYDRGQVFVMRVADFWEKVVFYLKIQAAEQKVCQRIFPGKIGGSVHLMHCPGVFHGAILVRHREISTLHNMGELKNEGKR